MNFYWHDHISQNPNEINSIFRELIELFEAKYKYKERARDVPCNGPFLCFVHPGSQYSSWRNIANVDEKKFILMLSFGGEPQEENSPVFSCRDNCWLKRGIESLKSNPERKSVFIESIKNGTPRMEILLRPPTDIKNLLAFYFFKIAKKKCKDDLVSKAFNEYNNVKNDYKLDCPDFCDAETFGKWSKEEIKKKILEKLYQ